MATRPEPESLNKILRDYSRRLHALETAPRTGFSSIPNGGSLTVTDDNGNPVLRIGTLSIGGYGIESWNGSAWVSTAGTASAADAAWIMPSLSNSWVNFGGSFVVARYRKLANRMVTIQGVVKNGVYGQTIFTLLPGYRPSADLIVDTQAGDLGVGRIDIRSDGVVHAQNGGTNSYLSLNHSFYADQ